MKGRTIQVVFIGGSARSGSTLLDLMLGQVDGMFSLGEICHIWERGFIENQLCGCGKPFKECGFWQEVIREAFGDIDQMDGYKALNLQRSVARIRHVPYLAFPRLRWRGFTSELQEYVGILDSLYKAIVKISNCNVLIDSSKAPPHGFVLSEIPDVELHVIHLVRDSRAVAYSWQRKKRRPEIYWKEAYMPRYGLIKATKEWMLSNLLVELLKNRARSFNVINYETLTRNPRKTIKKILENLGMNPVKLDFFKNKRVVKLGINHTVSGNPLRFRHGAIEIKPDEDWKKSMSLFRKTATTFITMLLLKRYGYSLNWKASIKKEEAE